MHYQRSGSIQQPMGLLSGEGLNGAVQTLGKLLLLGVQPLQREQYLTHRGMTGALDLLLVSQYCVQVGVALPLSFSQVAYLLQHWHTHLW